MFSAHIHNNGSKAAGQVQNLNYSQVAQASHFPVSWSCALSSSFWSMSMTPFYNCSTTVCTLYSFWYGSPKQGPSSQRRQLVPVFPHPKNIPRRLSGNTPSHNTSQLLSQLNSRSLEPEWYCTLFPQWLTCECFWNFMEFLCIYYLYYYYYLILLLLL